MNNPMNAIDPDGKDVWEINQKGEIINRIVDKTQDAFYIVHKNNNGDYQRMVNSDGIEIGISFNYKTVGSQKSITYSPDGQSVSYFDVYQVRGDNNGTKMFEFMSKNTSVEWSQAKTGIEGNKGLNFLSTSHKEGTESGMTQLVKGQLYAGYNMRELNHSHPSNSGFPSGLPEGKLPGTGDIGFSQDVSDGQRYNNLPVPTFQIYLPGSNKYVEYKPTSVKNDFHE